MQQNQTLHFLSMSNLQIVSQESHSLSHKFKDLLTSQNAYRHLCASIIHTGMLDDPATLF